jgi:hypothetical protein
VLKVLESEVGRQKSEVERKETNEAGSRKSEDRSQKLKEKNQNEAGSRKISEEEFREHYDSSSDFGLRTSD